MSSHAISPEEQRYQASGNLEAFWKSRLDKKDPVARIGYALWVSNTDKLKHAIETGDAKYWNFKGFTYWEFMARSTVVNLAVGLEKCGFRGNFSKTKEQIKKVGKAVAYWHIEYVKKDFDKKIGKIPGKLSLKQMADYHQQAFKQLIFPATFMAAPG